MITIIILLLLFLTVTLSLGGGLFEVLVIYPNWKYNVSPLTLKDKLESSGQNNAGRRFWPLVSPAQGMLSIINFIMAWNYYGHARCFWLCAAAIVFVTRLITFSYFIPVMLRKIMQPENIAQNKLQAIITRWTALSPLRLFPELIAWVLLCLTLLNWN